MQASTVRGYGYRYRRWVLDSLTYIDVQDLATGGDHIPELGELYVDIALVSRAAYQASGAPLSRAARFSWPWGQPGDVHPEVVVERAAAAPPIDRPEAPDASDILAV